LTSQPLLLPIELGDDAAVVAWDGPGFHRSG